MRLRAVLFLSLLAHSASAEPRGIPAYKLDLAVDGPWLTLSGLVSAAWLLRGELPPAYCAPHCDASKVNGFDREAAGNWNPTWARASDVAVAATVATALVLPAMDRGGLSDDVVIVESILTGNALAFVLNGVAKRPRPFLYSESAPLDARMHGNGSLSFFSGHTVAAFASTVSLFSTLHRRRPTAAYPWFVLGAGLATSSLVAVGRVFSGNHFPTDVLTGAAVGSALGVLVPALHVAPSVKVSPDSEGTGLRVTGSF